MAILQTLSRVTLAAVVLCAAAGERTTRAGAPGQDAAAAGRTDKWKEFAPAGGGFKILVPKEPKRDEAAVSIYAGRWRAETRGGAAGGGDTRFAVMYVEVGSCGRPDGVAMIGALRQRVLAELKGSVLRDAAISFDGRTGRLLEIAVEGTGHARVLLVAHGPRAYRLDVTTPGDGEADRVVSARFFNSFSVVAEREDASGEVDKLLASGSFPTADAGLINSRAIRKPAPHYPPLAKGARASGTVIVKVIVDEEGKVLAAQAVSGHPLLRAAAQEAARQARFEPPLAADGKPAKLVGCITYNFHLA